MHKYKPWWSLAKDWEPLKSYTLTRTHLHTLYHRLVALGLQNLPTLPDRALRPARLSHVLLDPVSLATHERLHHRSVLAGRPPTPTSLPQRLVSVKEREECFLTASNRLLHSWSGTHARAHTQWLEQGEFFRVQH